MKTLMKIWVYLLPFPLLFFFAHYWRDNGNTAFACYMIITPVLYGYLIPGIATNIMKKWKFNTPFRIGNYYAHHGFKYAANMNLWFFLASFAANLSEVTPSGYVTLAVATGAIHAFFIWWHDTWAIKLGMLSLSNVFAKQGRTPEEITFRYAPQTFFTLGASFGLSAIFAWKYLVEQAHHNWGSLSLVIVLGLIFMTTTSSIVFWVLEQNEAK